MAKITKRIPLDSIPLEDLSDPTLPDTPSSSPTPPSLPDFHPSFSFATPSDQTSAAIRNGSVDFSFPAEDLDRVKAWFTGDFSHVTIPESATLKKNMTAAVKETLDAYIAAAKQNNLFFSPFSIGWRLRLFDGSTVMPQNPIVLTPLAEAPQLLISSYNVYEKSLHTSVVFSKIPSQLLLTLPTPENAEAFKDVITDVELFISQPTDLYPLPFSVAGIRSVSSEAGRQRVWYYSSYSMENLEAMAGADGSRRIISTIPFSEVVAGRYVAPRPLPLEAGALSQFSSLPVLSPSSSSGSSSSSSSGGVTGVEGWRPYLHIATPPLSLSLPEREKAVTEVFLRGVFQRPEVRLSLYGSCHRENWQLIARSRGPYIRGLRRASFRWFKVEIALPMRPGDFLEALTFRFY